MIIATQTETGNAEAPSEGESVARWDPNWRHNIWREFDIGPIGAGSGATEHVAGASHSRLIIDVTAVDSPPVVSNAPRASAEDLRRRRDAMAKITDYSF